MYEQVGDIKIFIVSVANMREREGLNDLNINTSATKIERLPLWFRYSLNGNYLVIFVSQYQFITNVITFVVRVLVNSNEA